MPYELRRKLVYQGEFDGKHTSDVIFYIMFIMFSLTILFIVFNIIE